MGLREFRHAEPVPFVLMLTSTAVAFMRVLPIASRATTVLVMPPVTAMPVVMVPSIVPPPVIVMVFFPLSTFPISMAVIVSVAIPARTDDNNRRGIHRLGRIDSPRDANVDSNIDVRECDGRGGDSEAGNQRRCEPASACDVHSLLSLICW
jgi:hypothetical protein